MRLAASRLAVTGVLLAGSIRSSAHSLGKGGSGDPAVKRVLSTSWWPPGTEKKLESIGILSRGVVWQTGMMEENQTTAAQVRAELSDVSDIAEAGNTSLSRIVECLANCPAGHGDAVRAEFVRVFNGSGRAPALAVFEGVAGEFSGVPSSISCTAVRSPLAAFTRGTARAVRASTQPGVSHAWVSAHGDIQSAKDVWRDIGDVLTAAGATAGGADLVDCLVSVGNVSTAAGVRADYKAVSSGGGIVPPGVLSIVSPLPAAGASASSFDLRCLAVVNASQSAQKNGKATRAAEKRAVVGANKSHVLAAPSAVIAGDTVYVSGIFAKQRNATDAFKALAAVLKSAGSSMSLVLNCLFFARNQSAIQDVFAGFYEAFNENAPPPPTRAEYTALSECADCPILVKCTAALPRNDHQRI